MLLLHYQQRLLTPAILDHQHQRQEPPVRLRCWATPPRRLRGRPPEEEVLSRCHRRPADRDCQSESCCSPAARKGRSLRSAGAEIAAAAVVVAGQSDWPVSAAAAAAAEQLQMLPMLALLLGMTEGVEQQNCCCCCCCCCCHC